MLSDLLTVLTLARASAFGALLPAFVDGIDHAEEDDQRRIRESLI